MKNLFDETRHLIADLGYCPGNIIFIGSEQSGHCCTWDEFGQLANEEYDEGFGAQEVAHDLIIVFSDGFMLVRGEYDGSEYWEDRKPFKMPENKQPITCLFARIGWEDLAEINSVEGSE